MLDRKQNSTTVRGCNFCNKSIWKCDKMTCRSNSKASFKVS